MGKKSIWLPGAPPTPLRIPNVVKAGPWVFASGTMGGPVGGGLSPEFVAVEVREALDQLGGITGESVSDELLAEIFSKFCIGK